MLPDADRNELTLGLGYQFSDNLSVDVAYQLILFKDKFTHESSRICTNDFSQQRTAVIFCEDSRRFVGCFLLFPGM